MRWLDKVARGLGYVRRGRRSTGFAAADMSRLTASLRSDTEFINTTLRYQLRTLRARSRQACQNNPFARRFAQMVVDNVAGPEPFRLRAKVKNRKGVFDEIANDQIETGWGTWGKAGACELSGRWSWNTLQRLIVRTLAIDGEVLIRKYRGPLYGPHGFMLQQVDVDRLWENHNKALPGGGAIHMSVEVDATSKPVAYHLLKRKPAEWQNSGYTYEFDRVPAEEMIHLFVPESAEQVRGVPWMYAALLNLTHLGAFEEAAVIAARVGAAQMGFIETPDGGSPDFGDGTDTASGNNQIDAEPGSFPVLPVGTTLSSWNPKYPDAAVEPFIKAMLRGVASGLGVAYHNLASDMEGVNYSSARVAELDERDAWMSLQGFIEEHFVDPVYGEWLKMASMTGALPFDIGKLAKYRDVVWQGRTWAWVDPMKEVGAQIEAMNAKLKSRTQIIAETGEDLQDVFEEIAQEAKIAADLGVDITPIQPKATGVVPDAQAAGDGSGDTGKKK